MSRYDQFIDIVARVKPATIIEIGAHSGKRAVYLVGLAMEYQKRVHYIGFDVFDYKGAAFQEAALNGKGPATQKALKVSLRGLQRRYPSRFTYEIVVGDTRKTLKGRNLKADLVFIDGDHRLSTIRTDYAAVKNSRCVVFDDYFKLDDNGLIPDLQLYGANGVVDQLPRAVVLPVGESNVGCGITHMAVVENA